MKPWHFTYEPSHPPRGFKRWCTYSPSTNGLLIPSFLALTAVWCTRFYQAEPAPVVGTTKCPESLCLMLALPSSGRRVPPPPRTLLPVHSSYRLIRQSRVALLSLSIEPRSRSLGRLRPAPAATGTFPTLFCKSFPCCLSPYPGGPLSAFAWFFLSVIGLPQVENLGRLPHSSANAIFHGPLFEAAAISLCSSLTVCSPHRSLPPLQFSPQGGRGFYVRAERASLPSHASDMLSVRRQAIDGTRTLTSLDSQLCRLLLPPQALCIRQMIPLGHFSSEYVLS